MTDSIFLKEYIEEAIVALKGLGLSVRWGNDFEVFRRIIARHDERYEPSHGFNPECYENGGLDGVWLTAFRGTGELVHTQASRCVSVKPNLVHHLRYESNAYEPAYLKFDLENLNVKLSPEAAQIRGDAIYHGEAWLKGGPDGIRGGPALFIFSRMMIAKALLLWDVQHIFGLITPFTGIKGLPQRYGYTKCEQGAITFPKRPELTSDLWLVWMSREEAKLQLTLRPQYFMELMAPPEQEVVGKVA